MKHRVRFPCAALVALATALMAAPAHSSGSMTFDAAGSASTQAYNQGKRVASTELLCRTCPLAGQKLDKALAGRVLAESELTASLGADQRDALTVYLRRRFDL